MRSPITPAEPRAQLPEFPDFVQSRLRVRGRVSHTRAYQHRRVDVVFLGSERLHQ
jgi:hypothetical protein